MSKNKRIPPIRRISEYETLHSLILNATKNYRVTALSNNVWNVKCYTVLQNESTGLNWIWLKICSNTHIKVSITLLLYDGL